MGAKVSRAWAEQLETRVAEKFSETEIIEREIFSVNLQYRKIRPSRWNIQGNGALILTSNRLWFTLLKPQLDIDINLSQITNVSISDSLKRPGLRTKYRHSKMLCVEFTNDQGMLDEVVFALGPDRVQLWKQQIEHTKKSQGAS